MNVWLATIGEPVPVENGARDRLHRTGFFAHFLADHGHDVIWWTSTFNHFQKKHIFENDATLDINDHLRICLLHGCGYGRNLSLSRIKDHQQINRKFAELIRNEKTPDIIVVALPTLELSVTCVEYGKKHGIPVIVDIRDLWPDVFLNAAPALARPIASLALSSMYTLSRKALGGATAVSGTTDAYIDWGLERARRRKSELDRSFPLGYISTSPTQEEIKEAEKYWDDLGVERSDDVFTVCFFGALGHVCDIKTVIAAARELRRRGKAVRFVICGKGDNLDEYRQMTADEPNVLFPGWVGGAEIYTLMRRSDAGINPMIDHLNYTAQINNKPIEYMSAGLPVIACPNKGTLHELLKQRDCGFTYAYGCQNELADILSSLCENKDQLKKLSKNSMALFQDMFTAEKVYSGMMEYLEVVIASCRG